MTQITARAAAEIVSEMALLPYFPSDKEARAALVKLLLMMVSTEEQGRWLVQRVFNLWGKWEGPKELRAVFCSKFPPKDGINAYSSMFVEGIPSERAQLTSSSPLALPGGPVTADARLDAAVQQAAFAKRLPAGRRSQ